MLRFEEVRSLPRLAWCAKIKAGKRDVHVLHGPWVETNARWFAEGAWNGPFADGEFVDATILLGSGGRVAPNEAFVDFSATSHPMERLQTMRIRDNGCDELLVSNSLAFLFAQADDGPDPTYPFYDQDLMSFVDGLSGLVPTIKTRRGREIALVYVSNLRIDLKGDLKTTLRRRSEPPAFANYEEYVSFLNREIDVVHGNANDPARRTLYRPLATVSSGYDSPACAVLARNVGCNEALTFGSARPEDFGTDADDSGLEVGKHLGLNVTEYDRTEYLKRSDFPEAEFLAVGTGGEDVVMAAFEEHLPKTMFYTGFLGDTLWGRLHSNPDAARDFRMKFPAGSSLTEFRLRVGFIHAPIPLLTFTQHPSLHRISNSEEMIPWRSDNPRYDRPIPRRMAEEAGVPGHLFGQAKRAVTQPFYHNEPLRQIMSPASYDDFSSGVEPCLTLPDAKSRLAMRVLPRMHRVSLFVNRAATAVAGRLGRAVAFPTFVARHYRQKIAANAFTFHWAHQKLADRYAVSQHDEGIFEDEEAKLSL